MRWAEGEIRQAAIFAEHLRLTRRIEADLGGREFRLTDTVRNAGFDLTPHMFLYHINVGWPLLEEGTRFEAPIALSRARCDRASRAGAGWEEQPITISVPVQSQRRAGVMEIPAKRVFKCSLPGARICAPW